MIKKLVWPLKQREILILKILQKFLKKVLQGFNTLIDFTSLRDTASGQQSETKVKQSWLTTDAKTSFEHRD